MDNRKFSLKKEHFAKKVWRDRKNYSHRKTLGAAPVVTLPRELLAVTDILNQGDSPECTAFSAAAIRESMTGVKYDPQAQWEHELQFMGVTSADGAEIRTQLAVGVEVGFTPLAGGPPTDKASAFFWITREWGQDWFDAIRLTQYQLYQKYGKVIPVSIGLDWFRDWDNTPNGIVPLSQSALLGGHDVKGAGFETFSLDNEDYIVIQNSWGTGFGDNGLFRFNRAAANKFFGTYGIGYWLDDPSLQIKRLGLLASLLANLVDLYNAIIGVKTAPQVVPIVPTPPVPIPTPVPPVPAPLPTPPTPVSRFTWDTPAAACHSVRLICDEMDIPVTPTFDVDGKLYLFKDVVCACIQVESGFNPARIHQNMSSVAQGTPTVQSTDYGIVQVNDFYHIGKGKDFPSSDYVLANPEECVRWMIKMFLAGKMNLWVSFTSRAYKAYLP